MTKEQATNHPEPRTPKTGRGWARQSYLYEVQGLRTVAALIVAVYHIWFTRVSGGVDVFFVVSAYFLTLSLLRVADQPSLWAALSESWTTFLRILRRVLPGMATVLIATMIAAYFLMPRLFFSDQWSDAAASSVFLANVQFMRQADDYLAQGLDASAFQQFWALSIQMQFYVAGIATALLAYVIARIWRGTGATTRKRYVMALTLLLALVVIVTLPLGYFLTQSQPERAYFDPAARGWEFAVGGLLALALVSRRMRASRLWSVAGWVALVVLFGFAAIVDVSAHFPVWAAIVPVSAASVLILSARAGSAPAILRAKPLLALAPSSFSFYLWHWPVMIFWQYLTRDPSIGLLGGVAIIVISWALAYGTTHFLEVPFRSSPRVAATRWRTVVASALVTAVVFGSVAGYKTVEHRENEQERADVEQFLATGEADSLPVPSSTYVRDDLPAGYDNGCHQTLRDPEAIACDYGDIEAETTVALVGGSHSLQWLPPLKELGNEHGLRVVSMTKAGCMFGDETVPFGNPNFTPEVRESCHSWQREAEEWLVESQPDLVVTIGTRPGDPVEEIPEGYLRTWERLEEDEVPVLAIRDNPWWSTEKLEPSACLELVGIDEADEECSLPREALYDDEVLDEELPDNTTLVDLSDLFCAVKDSQGKERCGVLYNEVTVYRDHHHLTRTFTLTAVDEMEAALAAKLPEVLE